MKKLTQDVIDSYISYLTMIRISYGSFVYKEHCNRAIRRAIPKYGEKQTEKLIEAIKKRIEKKG